MARGRAVALSRSRIAGLNKGRAKPKADWHSEWRSMLREAWTSRTGGRESEIKAYCLYCETGSERKLAQTICEFYPDIYALPLLQEHHKIENGVRTLQVRTMLPGYIFLYTDGLTALDSIRSLQKAYYCLTYHDDQRELLGGDRDFALWVLSYHGLIVCSKALRQGDKVVIACGPLKSYAGKINKIDRHRRNAQVDIVVEKRVWTVWLAFDWLEAGETEKT